MSKQAGILGQLRGGLVVSCQADDGTSMCTPDVMAAVAVAAQVGGAVAVRIRGVDHIRTARQAVSVPVIGLTKRSFAHSLVYITPTWEDVRGCIDAGAHIVALDATNRPRPDGLTLGEIARRTRETSDVLLWADVADLYEGEIAAELGFDVISTTLAGYTGTVPATGGPDFELLTGLLERLDRPVIAEGRFTSPAQVQEAMSLGAWAVCVGKAITDPVFLTRQFTRQMRSG